MANKDPRFNFYPDNWSGGTKRMNFIQKGAYLELLLLNFYCFSDGLPGFTEEEALTALASATACAELWIFLKPKFKTNGAFFYSERMRKEFHKAKKNSDEQSKRALSRWNENPASDPASPTALPVNGYGNGIGIVSEEKGVQGEKETLDERLASAFDDIMLGNIITTFPTHNVNNELKIFTLKVRGSPKSYSQHDVEGLRKAFISQLSKSTSTNDRNGTKTSIRPAVTTDSGKTFGKWE